MAIPPGILAYLLEDDPLVAGRKQKERGQNSTNAAWRITQLGFAKGHVAQLLARP